MNRNTWTAELDIVRQGEHNWLLGSAGDEPIQILLVGAALDPSIWASRAQRVSIEWRTDGAAVDLQVGGKIFRVNARDALVHEFCPGLYGALPLAQFDARARRFWNRVFLLVRIPGGAALLRGLASGARASRKA